MTSVEPGDVVKVLPESASVKLPLLLPPAVEHAEEKAAKAATSVIASVRLFMPDVLRVVLNGLSGSVEISKTPRNINQQKRQPSLLSCSQG